MSRINWYENGAALVPHTVGGAVVLVMKEAAMAVIQQAIQVTDSASPAFDAARAEAFGGRMVGALNGASLVLMTSLGHQVGLFDSLAGLPPATSQMLTDAGFASVETAQVEADILNTYYLARKTTTAP
ncbi:MAG: hypothetical protein M3349_08255 [Actinomycetota bacterium]|nr:hypothetical protein [Actinomycetota bacterium]